MFPTLNYARTFTLLFSLFVSISTLNAQRVTYSNQDTSAPNNFEACPGTVFTLNYSDFDKHPDEIELTHHVTGLPLYTPVNPTNTSGSGLANNRSGTIVFTVPANAGTGIIQFWKNWLLTSTSLYTSTLAIHNPPVDFSVQATPVCASDTVPLIGFPSGGVFSFNQQTYPGLIVNDSIRGGAVDWSSFNDGTKIVVITYSYTPSYSNGAPCPQSIDKVGLVNVRDNRLSEVNFNYTIRTPPSSDDLTLDLNDTIINSTSPNLLDTSSFPYPVSFSGTYVFLDTSGNYKFITDQANIDNPVSLSYDNGGCIGEATGILNVYDPLRMIGLLDTVCSEAVPFAFTKDTLSDYAYSAYTAPTLRYAGVTIDRAYKYNEVTSVTTDNPIYQGAISTINHPSTNPDSTRYLFTPSNIVLNGTGVTSVPMQMIYTNTQLTTTTTTTTTTINGNTTTNTNTTTASVINSVIAFDTIHIAARPIPQILNLDSSYCPNTGDTAIQTIPEFEYGARTYFNFRGNDAFGYNIPDTLQQDTIFTPYDHYNDLVPLNNRHLDIKLTYTVDRYGCIDSTTAYTRIIAQVHPVFYPQTAYCTSDYPSPLSPTFAPNTFTPFSVTATFLPALGLDTVTQLFDPSIPGAGDHPVTLQMIDNFGCKSLFTDSLYVRIPPQIRLEVDSSNRTIFCSNEVSVPLSTILLSGNPVDSVSYYGPGVTGAAFDPSTIFTTVNGTSSNGGTALISVLYIDTFGCEGRDDAILEVRPVPVLRLDSSLIDQRYCGNASDFIIKGFVTDAANVFQEKEGVITGGGVILINGIYHYYPTELTVDSIYSDTVQYTYRDTFGCVNAISEVVLIDSIPEVSITGLDLKYCDDDTTDQLVGIPNNTVLFERIVFAGPGVNPNTGILTPSMAGTGIKIVSYTFEDKNNCENTAFDTTIIHGLPTPLFGGYLQQYCTAGALDNLSSLNDLSPLVGTASYYFWGTIISDSSGILAPNRDSSGLKTIYYTFIDSVECSNTDSVNIFIHPSPEILIDGLDSAYCFYSLEDNITVAPANTTFNSNDPGFSITSSNSLGFDPGKDTDGPKLFTLIYSDPTTNCKDTLSASTYVHKPQTPSYAGLDNFYCETRDTFLITGVPAGGTFNGQGIIDTTNSFSPAKAGGGIHIISYIVNDTFYYNADTLICQVDTVTSVTIRPLPVPTIVSPGNNFRFCSTDTTTMLLPGTPNTWNIFTSLTGGVEDTIETSSDTLSNIPLVIQYYPDTTYFFNPSLVDEGTHFVTYIAIDSMTGCQDSIQYTYIVDEYTSPFFALDSAYCESADSVILFGVPGGGDFLRNNATLGGIPPYFVPNPDYASNGFLPNSIIDTITYTVQDGACYGADTQFVLINPVPQISFRGDTSQTHNTYCLGMNEIPLTPTPDSITGIFTGNGVLFGTSAFIPDIAGAGRHPIYFNYTDSLTGCSNQHTDTFSVFGMPDVNFAVIGGCQSDSIVFLPDNVILGLDNLFSNDTIDSITSIIWEFAPGVTASGSHESNIIDSTSHIYTSSGVYETKLIVANQIHCVDTQIVRLVISPKVSNFPYDETFETSSGDWYAESRDSSYSLLWEWGIDSTPQGIASDLNNRFWSTQLNTSYSESDDAWVYSPCFDIDSLSRPMVKLDYWCDTRTAVDGAVLEYQKEDGTWNPLGELNRGINWFNSSIITGQPGDQNLAPTGWSGNSNGWVDARYKLDGLGNRENVRFRVAFGSPSINLGGDFHDGFGFDNFWVGSRTRNVLLETTANINEPAMDVVNNLVYQLVYHSPINEDLIMLQYHCNEPSINDLFHLDNQIVADARTYFYGISEAGRAYINGKTSGVPRSRYLQDIDFETEMLTSPKFKIVIDTFHHNSSGIFTLKATVVALENLPTLTHYRINSVITEDSLSYSVGGSMVHAVVRKDDEAANLYHRTWAIGDTQKVVMSWNRGSNATYHPGNFQAVVFIQEQSDPREVFQAKSSRDVSGYLVGVDQVEAEPELNAINSMNLYPNPAKDYFNVTFDAPLEHDYKWKLVGINGVEHQTGTVRSGDQAIQINNYDFPTGVYIFMVYNGKVFSQRKVIINQE
jgi:hypothetical protein